MQEEANSKDQYFVADPPLVPMILQYKINFIDGKSIAVSKEVADKINELTWDQYHYKFYSIYNGNYLLQFININAISYIEQITKENK